MEKNDCQSNCDKKSMATTHFAREPFSRAFCFAALALCLVSLAHRLATESGIGEAQLSAPLDGRAFTWLAPMGMLTFLCPSACEALNGYLSVVRSVLEVVADELRSDTAIATQI